MPTVIMLPDQCCVEIRLSLAERILALKSRLVLHCREIESVHVGRAVPNPQYRILGLGLGRILMGLFQTDIGRAFFIVRKFDLDSMVVLYTRRTDIKAVVLEMRTPDEAQKLAGEIIRLCSKCAAQDHTHTRHYSASKS